MPAPTNDNNWGPPYDLDRPGVPQEAEVHQEFVGHRDTVGWNGPLP